MKKLCKNCDKTVETNDLQYIGAQETLEGYKKQHVCDCGNGLLGDDAGEIIEGACDDV